LFPGFRCLALPPFFRNSKCQFSGGSIRVLKEIAKEKLSEVVKAIVPIVAIVLILSVTIVPMPTHVVMVFFYGCILLMIGMVFFTIGSEQAMEPMGKQVGARITKTRKLYLILPLGL
jgi:nucleoside recognition membrane protein YjiH